MTTPALGGAEPGVPDLPWYWPITTSPERLRALAAYDLTNPQLRADLDAVAAHTAKATGHPMAIVNAVLTDAQLALGSYGVTGWAAGGLPLECGFCLNIVIDRAPFVVPDFAAEPRVAGNPLLRMGLTGGYVGVPVFDRPTGEVLGAVCVLDVVPGACGPDDLTVLGEQAAVVHDLLAAARLG